MSLDALVERFIEDGIVDSEEAVEFENVVFTDGKVDREEADAAFAINNGTSPEANSPEWERVFVRTVSAYLLGDEVSPGTVDADEAAWLIESIEGDGELDHTEKLLCVVIAQTAMSIDESLTAKFAEWGI